MAKATTTHDAPAGDSGQKLARKLEKARAARERSARKIARLRARLDAAEAKLARREQRVRSLQARAQQQDGDGPGRAAKRRTGVRLREHERLTEVGLIDPAASSPDGGAPSPIAADGAQGVEQDEPASDADHEGTLTDGRPDEGSHVGVDQEGAGDDPPSA